VNGRQGLDSASKKFLRGELPRAEAARLEMILNNRRELQGLVANLAAGLIQNGCIDENVFDYMGYNLNTVASVKLRMSPVTRGSPYVIFGRSPLWRISE
jgi:hypothetical protein